MSYWRTLPATPKQLIAIDGYITIVENELYLDGFIRDKLSEIECMHDYSVGTDTVRCWLDEYNDLSKNKLK